MQRVVVTRHGGLVEYLLEIGLIQSDDQVISHAEPADVRDKDVIGVLPLSLAALANSVTEVPLNLPAHLRGQEFTLDQVRELAGEPVTYSVKALKNAEKLPAVSDDLKIVRLVSSYYGSHEELGEGDRTFTFAVPRDWEGELDLSHGHGCYRNNLNEEAAKLPAGSLFLDEETEKTAKFIPVLEMEEFAYL